MSLLDVHGLSVEIGKRSILDKVNLHVEPGQFIALVGANGSGKTSLLKAINGILPASQGEIIFSGKALQAYHSSELASRLAYLPQGNQFFWPVSVENLIMLGRLPCLKPWQSAGDQDYEKLVQVMHYCDVTDLAKRRISELSGGERARVMLARALVAEPELLLADEAIAGLDPEHQLQILQLFQDLVRQGMSIILVIHDLSLAVRYCEFFYLLKSGKMHAQGTAHKVLTEDNMASVFNIRLHHGCVDGSEYVIPLLNGQGV